MGYNIAAQQMLVHPLCQVYDKKESSYRMDIVSSNPSSSNPCSICRERPRPEGQSYCRECRSAYQRARYTPSHGRDWNLRYLYDITPEEYDLMLFRQGGVCAICKQPETTFDKRIGRVRLLAVDHDHENGNVRGLLCAKCNGLLGAIESDPDRFKALMKYKNGK